MKVMVIGQGAREHALCWRLNQSPTVWKLYCVGSNPGIAKLAESVPIAADNASGLIDFARDRKVDLTVVGSEEPLAAGIVDQFDHAGLKIFGPTKAAAQLESSKAFAKTVMREAGVPTAAFEVFDDAAAARSYVRSMAAPPVVKADGLAFGKGVVVADDIETALAAVDDALERHRFGSAGARIVIEERIPGEELSFFALCDGDRAVSLGFAQDHKTIFDGDRGPNTGGMGAYAPTPHFDSRLETRAMNEVVRPILAAMNARGIPFRGVLFAGLMVDGNHISVLEFNVRFGDPECEPLMMRFEGDLGEVLMAAAEGNLDPGGFRLSPRSAASVVIASGGYPGEYRKGLPISGLERIDGAEPSDAKVRWAMARTRVKVFHAGTAIRDGRLVTNGGRVLAVTAMADDLAAAVAAAYEAADMIEFEGMHMRRDIARKALARLGNARK